MSWDTAATNDEFVEQIPEYALGALDPEEAARLEAHLAGCATCQAELDAFQAVTGALALSLDPAPEPVDHFARFQQKLEALDPLVEPPGHRERFLTKLNAQAETPPLPAPAPRRPWWQALNPLAGWGLAGALALLLLFAVMWGLDSQRRATEALQQAQASTTQASAILSQRDTLARLLANPATRSVTLTGQVNGQSVQARLVADPATGQAVLVADQLPPVTGGQVYELWLIRGQTPVAINLLASDTQGQALLIFQVPGALTDYDVAALTVEPGFVPKPTTAPVAAGNL